MSTVSGDRVVTEPSVLRALAHPARLAVIDLLTSTGKTATATECAEVAGLSPSAMSYHLRTLAKAGLIEEAPGRGDGRERLWRAPMTGLTLRTEQDAPDEDKRAFSEVVDLHLDRLVQRVRHWIATSHEESPEWYEAVTLAESRVVVTAEEMAMLRTQIRELLEPYQRPARPEPPEGAREATMALIAVPLQGPEVHRKDMERKGIDGPG
ncbi:transcriptional regulator [Actinorhabdospora filicis]|uniref:Transcriptional regulator n=1 Tax=Actinorhabdospora filicis TaxID=1785913 RepID=A0A9W6SR36_9ACTN|nr:winged helix-turn-helix domain-containing protein [Actinorhabdospora filicis]GLZ80808.1 transcriptional regulator [Actinorhabdospora filicis]